MAIRSDNFEFDPFSAPTPGQSFTDTPGSREYEKQPKITSPKQALEIVSGSLTDPIAQKSVSNLLNIGISAETIASSLVLKMFSEGVFSPDVAEIIKPPLIAVITDIGAETHVEDINVVNQVPEDGMSGSDSLELMQQTNTEKFQKIMGEQVRTDKMGELADRIDFPEEEQAPQRESFLDMGAA